VTDAGGFLLAEAFAGCAATAGFRGFVARATTGTPTDAFAEFFICALAGAAGLLVAALVIFVMS
jgi:hypothetical protein